MKFLSFVLFLFLECCGLHAVSQDLSRSFVLSAKPAPSKEVLRINKLIANLRDDGQVEQKVLPFIKKYKLSGEIYVAHKDGSHSILYFGKRDVVPAPINASAFWSKGDVDLVVSNSGDFESLPDSLVLLDTLTVQVNFTNNNFPLDSYYLTVDHLGVVKEVELVAKGKTLSLPPSWFIAENHASSIVTLRNRKTSGRILWQGLLCAITASEEEQLKTFALSILKTGDKIERHILIKDLMRYAQLRFGLLSNVQINHWLDRLIIQADGN